MLLRCCLDPGGVGPIPLLDHQSFVNRRSWQEHAGSLSVLVITADSMLRFAVQVQLRVIGGSEAGATPEGQDGGRAAAVAAARAGLRARVVALTRAAAAAGPETNEVECGKVFTPST